MAEADDECQVAEGVLQVAGGELKTGDEQRELEAGGCDDGQSSEPMPEGSSGPITGHDSQRVTEDATDDEIGILSHEGAHAAGQPGQGDGVGQCLSDDVTTPQKARNKANLESKQGLESQELKSENTRAEGRKQSQSSKGETRRKPRSRDGRPARQSGRRPVASEAEGGALLRAAGIPSLRRSDDLDSPGDGQMKSRTHRGVEDRHAVFGTGVRARTACMLASLRVHGIHLTRQRQGQASHFCHKQWITSRHTGTSGE
jgi:hypothetical protein